MVVSTERDPSTAVTDAPAPRWQTSSRPSSAGRPNKLAARRVAQAQLSPWNPKRRRPHRAAQSSGTA